MSIDEILDEMDELLDRASAVPFAGHKCIVDGERVRELINDVRLNVPQEIKHAKMVEFDRDRIIKEAEARAEYIVREAEERAKTMEAQAKERAENLTSEQSIIQEARQRAVSAVTKAKQECDAIRSATDAYIEKRFQETENYFSGNLKDVQQKRQQLQQLKNAGARKNAPGAK